MKLEIVCGLTVLTGTFKLTTVDIDCYHSAIFYFMTRSTYRKFCTFPSNVIFSFFTFLWKLYYLRQLGVCQILQFMLNILIISNFCASRC